MATPEPTATSRRLESAARAERDRLLRRLESQQEQIQRLRADLTDREAVVEEIQAKLALLAQITPTGADDPAFLIDTPHLRAVDPPPDRIPDRGYLRGVDIRIAAVRILAATENPSHPIRYGAWYSLFTTAGYGIAGHDPQAVFLTQISRSVLVRRTGERGVYVLDLDLPRRLRDELHVLHQELAGLHEGQQTIEEIATVATRRGELTDRVVKIERALEEAVVSLGFDPDENGR